MSCPLRSDGAHGCGQDDGVCGYIRTLRSNRALGGTRWASSDCGSACAQDRRGR